MKKNLFTGLIILLPVALTLMVIIFLFDLFTTPFVPMFKSILIWLEAILSIALPDGLNIFLARVLALVVLSIFVLLLGVIARWLFIRDIIRATHSILVKIPLIKTIFKVSRDVFSAIFAQEGNKAFKEPVMFPFPDYPNHSIGFELREVPHECTEKVQEKLVAVFAPTAPHPMSGFLIFINQKDVYPLDMTNEDAIKLVLSCGMIVPADHKQH